MIRGKNIFRCDECGKIFINNDIELAATVFSAPTKCKRCGSWHTYPLCALLYKPMYKRIWKEMDTRNNNENH